VPLVELNGDGRGYQSDSLGLVYALEVIFAKVWRVWREDVFGAGMESGTQRSIGVWARCEPERAA